MPRSSAPRSRLYTAAAASGTLPASAEFLLHPSASQFTFASFFDQAGTLNLEFKDTTGTWRAFGSRSVTAGIADIATYFGNIGPVRATFVPGVTPVTGFVECSYSGGSSAWYDKWALT